MEAKVVNKIEKAKRLKTVEEEFGIGRNVDPYYEINALRAINTDLELRLMKKEEEEVNKCKERFFEDLCIPIDTIWEHYKKSKDTCMLSQIYTMLVNVIERSGGAVFGSEGDNYNHEIHELVAYDNLDDDPTIGHNQITKVLSPGIKIGEKIIRPAKVLVKF